MKAEVISIGTELLLGNIVNTNAAYLAKGLAALGLETYYQTTVGDNPARLTESIRRAALRSDIVLMTGGLGPTIDDITIDTVALLTDSRLVLNKAVFKRMNEYFRFRKLKTPPDSIRQAYVPSGAKIILNKIGSAPGLITNYRGSIIICLPGPPRELGPMFEHDIAPYLKDKCVGGNILLSKMIKTTGLAESQVNRIVKDLLKLKPPMTVGIYAKLGQVELNITAKAKVEAEAKRAVAKIEKKIRSRLKDYIFGCDDETLESAVGNILLKKHKTIAVAESCTGGLVANRLTNVSGSSKYFLNGIISYSNESKARILGVPPPLIKVHGAVYKEVALWMAKGVRFLAGSDFGLALTGIAGPTGGTKSKPVGLVYVALVTCHKVIIKEFRFRGTREEIKFQSSQVALDMIRRNA